MNEVLEVLGLSDTGNYIDDNTYQVELTDDTYGEVFSKLDKSDVIEEVGTGNTTTTISCFYVTEDDSNNTYYLDLTVDYEKGKYTLTIEKDNGQYDPDFDEEEETDE